MTDTIYIPRHRADRQVDAPSRAGRLHYSHYDVRGRFLSRPIGTHCASGFGTCTRCGTTCTTVWPVPVDGAEAYRCEWCR